MNNKTNWLAVLVCAIAGMGIGYLWYGALFQNQWMAGNGITMDGETMMKYGKEVTMGQSTPMIVNAIGMLALALILNFLINKTNHTTLSKGLVFGLIIGVIASINILLTNLFAQNPMSLTLVDASYITVLLGVMGLILGAWRKK